MRCLLQGVLQTPRVCSCYWPIPLIELNHGGGAVFPCGRCGRCGWCARSRDTERKEVNVVQKEPLRYLLQHALFADLELVVA